jgi:aspartate carbamoyltransferase regulatory subunit
MEPLHKTRPVAAIKDGTVIDHIKTGQALRIARLLKLDTHHSLVTLGLNLPSETLGYKDLIKVKELELTPEEANRVAIFSPTSTINIIQNYEVSKKFQVEIPPFLTGVFACPNPKCITKYENVLSTFLIKQRHDVILIECKFCKKSFCQNDMLTT